MAQEQRRQTETREWEPKRYLIQAKWWSQWCDYVNFDSKLQLDNSADHNLLPKPLDSPHIHLQSQESDQSQLYEKPSRIVNQNLLADPVKGQRQRLRNNLIEHFDYETLYPIVWKHLYSWYSADIQIVRQLRKDVMNRHVMMLELYPEDMGTKGGYYRGKTSLDDYDYESNRQQQQRSQLVARNIKNNSALNH